MSWKIAKRGAVPPFIVMDVMRAANEMQAQGDAVLHLEVGQPGTPAPDAVLKAAQDWMARDLIGYTNALGVPALRQAIAEHYTYTYGVTLDPECVVVTTGSSAGFTLAFLAAFDHGDRVALAAPGYPAYRNILSALGLEVVSLLSGEEDRFQPSPALLDKVEGPLQGLIVASPANPTGTMLSKAALAELVSYCEDRHIRLISDEIYHGISYGESAHTALEFTDKAFVINSFSKYFSMTGWRIGWTIAPPELLRSVECLAQNFYISAPTLSQLAAITAFDCRAELDAYVAQYARNRALLLRDLPKAGLGDLAPADGAFYIYADIGDYTNDSQDFCRRLLEETAVATTPGVDFDPERGHRTLRLSFAGTEETMAEACHRLGQWLDRS